MVAVTEAGVLFAVCHVLRYRPYTRMVKRLVDEGRLGEIVSVQHLEPVGHWHYAHSYVRGNWRRTDQASFMLLAKSGHDIDWLRWPARPEQSGDVRNLPVHRRERRIYSGGTTLERTEA